MGFRSTFITTDNYNPEWPKWIRDKYKESIYFPIDHSGCLCSIHEHKTYDSWKTLHEDIQKAIDWNQFKGRFTLIFLHECGDVTRCEIEKDSIQWSEPESWIYT